MSRGRGSQNDSQIQTHFLNSSGLEKKYRGGGRGREVKNSHACHSDTFRMNCFILGMVCLCFASISNVDLIQNGIFFFTSKLTSLLKHVARRKERRFFSTYITRNKTPPFALAPNETFQSFPSTALQF